MKNLLLFACGLLSAGAALADDTAIVACRAQADTARRLACYDAIPVGAVAAAAPAAVPAQNFGLRPAQQKQASETASIHSTVAGDFDGWSPNAIIKLANGQVWRVTDGSEAVMRPMQNPKVEISRGLLGAGYYLQVEGYNNTARVSRVQ